jgi:hypothetical protein
MFKAVYTSILDLGQGALRIPTKIKLELKPRLEERQFNGVCIDYFEPKINVKQQSLPVL